MYRHQENAEFHPIPDRVEIIPDGGEGPEQLSGGCSRPLQQFQCEKCGFKSSRFSMYAMIYDGDGQFAMRKASEDEAKLIAA